MSVLKGDPEFAKLLTMFTNPILGVLAGTLLTAIVQSSSASVGILQALSSTGAISFGAAIPIIMGQNIGTCVTAMISSVGANKNGKRAAFIHLYYNIIGVAVFLTLYYLVGWILGLTGVFDLLGTAAGTTIDMWGIALVHTLFKVFCVIVLSPMAKLLEKLAVATVRGDDKKGDEYTEMLDERLFVTPTVAIDRSRTVIGQMAHISMQSFKNSMVLLDAYDSKVAESVRADEDKADIYEDILGTYLVKLSAHDMDEKDSHESTKLLHLIGDFERISDHAVNLVESAEELNDKGICFSDSAVSELATMRDAVAEILAITEDAFINGDVEKAATVEPLEQVVDELRDEIKLRHIRRLQKNECSIEHGFVLSDILNNLERVSDHCSNIAGCIIEMSRHDALDLHEYLHNVKKGGVEFHKLYDAYTEKYALPEAKTNN